MCWYKIIIHEFAYFYSLKTSQDEAVRQKEALVSEVACLRIDLQQVREDRDRQLLQVQALSSEVLKYKERTGETHAVLHSLNANVVELEVCASVIYFFL